MKRSQMLDRAVMFRVILHAWGNVRKAGLDKITTNAEKRALRLAKTLVESEEYDAIMRHLRDTKAWCVARCVPSFMDEGVFIVKDDVVPDFDAHLEEAQATLKDLVEAFVAVYPRQIEDARTILNDMFDERDYPTANELREKFSIEWRWIRLTVPDSLSPEIREKEAAKLRASYERAEEEITRALREGMTDVLGSIVERLTPDDDGKKKIFRDSLFDNLISFVETFNSRNILDDAELAEVVAEAKKVLAGVNIDAVRFRRGVRLNTRDAFEALKAKAADLVVKVPGRRFNFDEEK